MKLGKILIQMNPEIWNSDIWQNGFILGPWSTFLPWSATPAYVSWPHTPWTVNWCSLNFLPSSFFTWRKVSARDYPSAFPYCFLMEPSKVSLGHWFSIRGDYASEGDILETFVGRGITGFWWIEASGATKHPTMHRVAPKEKSYQAQNVFGVKLLVRNPG